MVLLALAQEVSSPNLHVGGEKTLTFHQENTVPVELALQKRATKPRQAFQSVDFLHLQLISLVRPPPTWDARSRSHRLRHRSRIRCSRHSSPYCARSLPPAHQRRCLACVFRTRLRAPSRPSLLPTSSRQQHAVPLARHEARRDTVLAGAQEILGANARYFAGMVLLRFRHLSFVSTSLPYDTPIGALNQHKLTIFTAASSPAPSSQPSTPTTPSCRTSASAPS